MEPEVRLTRPTDINTIRDLDIKCYDYPLEMDDWKELLNNSENMIKANYDEL